MDKRKYKKYALAAAFFALLLLPHGAVACQGKGDTELDSLVEELNAVLKEIAAKIENDPSITGLDAAQKIFDGKKEAMRERTRQFRRKGAGVSEAALKKLFVSVISNSKLITDAFAKNASLYAENPTSGIKFQLLIAEYFTTFYHGELDELVESFIEEFNTVSREMTANIANKKTSAGIDDAQRTFEAKRAVLKEKFGTFKNAVKMQVSEEILKKLTDSIINNGKALSDAFVTHARDYARDRKAGPKFQKLMKDYVDTFTM